METMKKRYWCQECRTEFGDADIELHRSGRQGRHSILEQHDLNHVVRGIVSGCKDLIRVPEDTWERTRVTIGDLSKKGSPRTKLDIVDALDAAFQIVRYRIDASDHVALFLLEELKKRVVVHH